MATISATSAVTIPATDAIVYNQWYLTQLIIKANTTTAPAIVHLHRSATVDGNIVLMPNGPGAEISFNVDIFQQLSNPAFATAMEAVTEAVVSYASSKSLL